MATPSTPYTDDGPVIAAAYPPGALNVKLFGAVGDGVVDDTADIQLAIDYLGVGGGALYFPLGVYKITSPLTFGGAGAPRSGVSLVGEARSGIYAPQAIYDDGCLAGGTVLQYAGDSGDDAILDVNNTDSCSVRDLGFDAHGLANYCVRFRHNVGDERSPHGWLFSGCSFTSGRLDNIGVVGTDPFGYGDMSGMVFEACAFTGSYFSSTTNSHYNCSTQYTFGTVFNGCWFSAQGYPSYALDMTGGTANVVGGGFETFSQAAVRLANAPGMDFPAVTLTGCEAQTSNKFLVTDTSVVGGNFPIRSSVITGLLCNDINAPIATEMIYWNVESDASLVLVGCNILGDINLDAAGAKLVMVGTTLYGTATLTGTGIVSGTWYEDGIFKHVFPDLPTYADDAAAASLAAGTLYRTAAGAVMSKL